MQKKIQKKSKKSIKNPKKSKNYQKWSENPIIWKNLKTSQKITIFQKI